MATKTKVRHLHTPNSNQGVVDSYARIASDNRAKEISTSWGISEGQANTTTWLSSLRS